MRDIARGTVTIDHPQRRFAGIGQLVKNAGRNVDSFAGADAAALLAEAHFAGAFNDKVDLFLLLVMPRDLSAVRFERDIPHREIDGLNRARAADKILRAPSRGIGAASDLRKVCDDHVLQINHRLTRASREGPAAPVKPLPRDGRFARFLRSGLQMSPPDRKTLAGSARIWASC